MRPTRKFRLEASIGLQTRQAGAIASIVSPYGRVDRRGHFYKRRHSRFSWTKWYLDERDAGGTTQKEEADENYDQEKKFG